MHDKKHNIYQAAMSRRLPPKKESDKLDDFPTPPWATRALMDYVIKEQSIRKLSCLEPACNSGHMSKVLQDYFKTVTSSDIHDYGYGKVIDFLNSPYKEKTFDWVITNPPFSLAEDFLNKAREIASTGVALLARTVFLESVGRYERIFKDTPPSVFAQFTERVPMLRGRLDKTASTATGYAWFVWWLDSHKQAPQLIWIPPCRKRLEKDGDYDKPPPPDHTPPDYPPILAHKSDQTSLL